MTKLLNIGSAYLPKMTKLPKKTKPTKNDQNKLLTAQKRQKPAKDENLPKKVKIGSK